MLHGRTFATLFDVVDEMAFYVDEKGRVEGAVEDSTVGEVVEGLGLRQIVWMPAAEGCSRPWTNLASHKELTEKLLATLSRTTRAIELSLESTELGEGLPEGRTQYPRDF